MFSTHHVEILTYERRQKDIWTLYKVDTLKLRSLQGSDCKKYKSIVFTNFIEAHWASSTCSNCAFNQRNAMTTTTKEQTHFFGLF
jgi:hypothetical protein